MLPPLTALCRCLILSEDLPKAVVVARAASGPPCSAPFATALTPATDPPLGYLVLLSRGIGACLWAPGGCPGASTSAVWALGGPSCFGPGLVRAVLVHWSHVVGLGGAALCVMGTGRMQVLWSGRWVAGCGSCRRVQLVAVLWCCWPALGADVTRLCVCLFLLFSCLCLPASHCVSL